MTDISYSSSDVHNCIIAGFTGGGIKFWSTLGISDRDAKETANTKTSAHKAIRVLGCLIGGWVTDLSAIAGDTSLN